MDTDIRQAPLAAVTTPQASTTPQGSPLQAGSSAAAPEAASAAHPQGQAQAAAVTQQVGFNLALLIFVHTQDLTVWCAQGRCCSA